MNMINFPSEYFRNAGIKKTDDGCGSSRACMHVYIYIYIL